MDYHDQILSPAAYDFQAAMSGDCLRLHHAFQANMLAAHALDYLLAIRHAAGDKATRTDAIKSFDSLYGVPGARIRNWRFRLVDGVNNALKHIRLDRARNRTLLDEFGIIAFSCLREDDGRVLFDVESYRFDFGRVVLRPVFDVIIPPSFENEEDVLSFAHGEWTTLDCFDADETDDPIDQMISHCNPECLDCGESEPDCRCSTFLYRDEQGEFHPREDTDFDFDRVMSRISGAY